MHELLDSITSYVVALGLLLSSNLDSFLSWGGLLLLVIRLVTDGPRAWKNIKEWFK